jgi:membrane-bound ClpP family serine protease
LILRVIESRSEKVGAIIASVLGMGWSAVTYFVVPVIVVESVGPIEAAKRSFQVLKKTWGEALVANFGIGIVVFLASLVGIIPIIGGVVALGAGMTALGIAAIVLGAVALLTVSLISSAMNSIIIGALYLYAAEGTVPEQFDDDLFKQAFAHK